MSLFQNSVLKKYLKALDQDVVNESWNKFTNHFHNPTIQENIRNSKEEQYQGEFLIDLFVKVLDYTKNPEPNFNLTTELKNVKGAKKTDGAILKDDKAIAVIELKGTKITDLSKIESQAFGYKNNQPGCNYVITSNFEKLRFYIDNAVDFEEFNLFQLTKERFDLLWLCLSCEHILKGLPKKIKEESLTEEEAITKKLYKDYALFRTEIFNNIIVQNPQFDKLTLFKKTQKLLDRFLFIFFSEDRLLLPPNSIRKIINQWTDLRDKYDEYFPLYDRFKKYFGYMNTGHIGKQHEIFAYNGGLFKSDEVLDTIKIDDDLLYKHTLNLSNYDFESEVSVNILGHIFEHSLNEIEEIQSELEGQEIDRTKTKRKKDGVFYTPKYITKYIVDNTIGKLCEEKKKEIGIVEEEYEKERKGRRKKTLKALNDKLDEYRKWLLQITICDPACGSGAFLNQALEFLIAEHHYIDELQTKLFEDSFILPNVDNAILENNLFGVDVNEESIEIAKLSLWLRTAKKGRKLTSLSDNIKCGNSLIDDPEVAGKKAFDWEKEFPKIFEKGGFDIVIGNPPYVRAELLGQFRSYLENHFTVFDAAGDLFSFFYEKSFSKLLNQSGLFGFISNTFDKTTAGLSLRRYLKNEVILDKYVDFTEVQIFEGATTYPVIIIAENKKPSSNKFHYIKIRKDRDKKIFDIDLFPFTEVTQDNLEENNWSFKSDQAFALIQKICVFKNVREIYGKCYYGIKTALNSAFIIPKQYKIGDHVKPIYEGKELKKWVSPPSVQQLILFESKWTKREYGEEISEEEALFLIKRDYSNLINQILPFIEKAKKRYDKGDFFWELRNCAYYDLFEKPKVVFPNLQNSNKFSYDTSGSYINAPAVILPTEDRFLVSILNSKLVWYFLTNICVVRSGGYIEVKPQYFEQIPIPVISDPTSLEKKTEEMIGLNFELHNLIGKFLRRLKDNLGIEKFSKKLEKFYSHDFKGLLVELKKQKINLSLSDQDIWEEYFNEYKDGIIKIQADIFELDLKINQTVYDLYGLTEEEIQIVEESVN